MFGNLKECPKPLGSHIVGITDMEFTDKKRKDVYDFTSGEYREIPVTVFYPADSSGKKPKETYIFPEAVEFWNKSTHGFISRKIALIKTHCYRDVPVSQKEHSYPVVFFNHGYSSYQMQNTVLCTDLASRGYIVFSIGHPHESSTVKFSDGRIISIEKSLSERFKQEMGKEISDKFYKHIIKKKYTDEELMPVMEEFNTHFRGTAVAEHAYIWADDNSFIADCLPRLNDGSLDSIFKGKLCTENGLGITGHSYGGVTATVACISDERFACGVNIDAPIFGEYWNSDVNKPFMIFGSNIVDYAARSTFISNSKDSYLVIVENTKHMDFTDFIYFCRQTKMLGLLGKRKMTFLRDILSEYHTSFFDKYLRGSSKAGLNGIKYDGITVRSK